MLMSGTGLYSPTWRPSRKKPCWNNSARWPRCTMATLKVWSCVANGISTWIATGEFLLMRILRPIMRRPCMQNPCATHLPARTTRIATSTMYGCLASIGLDRYMPIRITSRRKLKAKLFLRQDPTVSGDLGDQRKVAARG